MKTTAKLPRRPWTTARSTATRSPWTTPSPRARAASEEVAGAAVDSVADSVVDSEAVAAAAGEDVAALAAAAVDLAAEEEEAPEVADVDGVAALEVCDFVLFFAALKNI